MIYNSTACLWVTRECLGMMWSELKQTCGSRDPGNNLFQESWRQIRKKKEVRRIYAVAEKRNNVGFAQRSSHRSLQDTTAISKTRLLHANSFRETWAQLRPDATILDSRKDRAKHRNANRSEIHGNITIELPLQKSLWSIHEKAEIIFWEIDRSLQACTCVQIAIYLKEKDPGVVRIKGSLPTERDSKKNPKFYIMMLIEQTTPDLPGTHFKLSSEMQETRAGS